MEQLFSVLFCLGFFFMQCGAQNITCRNNEEYYECEPTCTLTCSNYQDPMFCSIRKCTPGCYCKPEYVLGPNNSCIPPDQCPSEPVCPKNEHYVSCVNQCSDCWYRGNCEQSYCQPGCDCIAGYLRDDSGKCVPESQCSSESNICGENEEYTDCVCPCNDCESRCNCKYSCEFGCDCKPGYHRNLRGVCVPADQCPSSVTPRSQSYKCGLNEEYSFCVPNCRSTCDTLYETICHTECRPGCACRNDLVRNHEGICVLPQECRKKQCGQYEEFSECGPACPITCENIVNPVLCTQKCVAGCFCSFGYVKGPDGKCIKPHLCPSACGENEMYQACGPSNILTCQNRTIQTVSPGPCRSGWFCKRGFIRDLNTGNCVTPDQCPQVCGEYEEFETCGTSCPVTCQNRHPPVPCRYSCTRGCFCSDGYIRDLVSKKCVRPEQCPRDCRKDEVFLECGPACDISCRNLGKSISCTLQCTSGCFCRDGLVRAPDNSCIPPEYCPLNCGENEEFSLCGSHCEPTCGPQDPGRVCILGCKKGCFCKKGFVRDGQGRCVDPNECPRPDLCPGAYEEYKLCGSLCFPTCDRPTPRLLCPLKCARGCFCQKGYVRNTIGACVTPQNCSTSLRCPVGEEFYACKPTCRNTCDELFSPNPRPCEDLCQPGCSCRRGTLRRSDGSCVAFQDCTTNPQDILGIQGRRLNDDELIEEETTVSTSASSSITTSSEPVPLQATRSDAANSPTPAPSSSTAEVKSTVSIPNEGSAPKDGATLGEKVSEGNPPSEVASIASSQSNSASSPSAIPDGSQSSPSNSAAEVSSSASADTGKSESSSPSAVVDNASASSPSSAVVDNESASSPSKDTEEIVSSKAVSSDASVSSPSSDVSEAESNLSSSSENNEGSEIPSSPSVESESSAATQSSAAETSSSSDGSVSKESQVDDGVVPVSEVATIVDAILSGSSIAPENSSAT